MAQVIRLGEKYYEQVGPDMWEEIEVIQDDDKFYKKITELREIDVIEEDPSQFESVERPSPIFPPGTITSPAIEGLSKMKRITSGAMDEFGA